MRAIDFPEANRQYGKPESMTDEECYPVSTYEHRVPVNYADPEGPYTVKSITTVWQPNKEDIEAILAGRPIMLQWTASFLVPHALYTCDEKGNINE